MASFVLIGLDGFAVGLREWDLVLTAVYCGTFGWRPCQEYVGFARVCGVRRRSGYPVLREAREFVYGHLADQKAAEDSGAGRGCQAHLRAAGDYRY